MSFLCAYGAIHILCPVPALVYREPDKTKCVILRSKDLIIISSLLELLLFLDNISAISFGILGSEDAKSCKETYIGWNNKSQGWQLTVAEGFRHFQMAPCFTACQHWKQLLKQKKGELRFQGAGRARQDSHHLIAAV